MPNVLISGPAGAGKSQEARRLRAGIEGPAIILEFQTIYAAILGIERGPDGRYPPRRAGDGWAMVLTEYLRQTALRQALERDIAIVLTNSDGSPARRQELLTRLGPGAVERVIDPGEPVIRQRLRLDLELDLGSAEEVRQRQCEEAAARWYGRR